MRLIKSFTIKALLLALIVSVALMAYPVRWYVRSHRFESAFDAVQVGDSKDEVIKQCGQPDENSPCFHPSAESELQRICADEFWYYSFLERWGISFDKQGKVIAKTYNVSY